MTLGKVEPKTEIWVDYMVCEVLDFLLNDSAANFNCGSLVSSFWLVRSCLFLLKFIWSYCFFILSLISQYFCSGFMLPY